MVLATARLSPGFAEVQPRGAGGAQYRLFTSGGTVRMEPGGIRFEGAGPGRAAPVLEFCNGREGVEPAGAGLNRTRVNLIEGPEPAWRTHLPAYEAVRYSRLWPGIDLLCREGPRGLKYEFHVAPGADPSDIRLRYRGAERLAVNAGGQLEAAAGSSRIVDDAPVAWQERDGRRVPVPCEYRLEGARHGFNLGSYDASLPLIIDPAVIVYSGYVGGAAGFLNAMDVAVDGTGAAYVLAMRSPFEPGMYLAKVLPDGSGLEWFVQFGPGAPDLNSRFIPYGIAVDSQRRAVVCGVTHGPLPLRTGPDPSYNGGATDAFVSRFAADGTLDYSGYIGGAGGEDAWDVAVDSAGAAYVVGQTDSDQSTFPVAVGPDLIYNGGSDGFVAKIRPDGTGLEYCGYVGGDSWDCGWTGGIGVDAQGRARIAGHTASNEATFPVSVGPDLTYNGGGSDAFVACVDAGGASLLYCGYIGGSGGDRAMAADVLPDGSLFLGGSTSSADFPVTVGPDLTHHGGGMSGTDAFVARVPPDGTGLAYCGYIGGAYDEEIMGVAVDPAGRLAVQGWTRSDQTTFPVREGPDLTHNGTPDFVQPGAGSDAFVASVHPTGGLLRFCGYLGSSGIDSPERIATGADGAVYACGAAGGADFPAVVGPDLNPTGAYVTKVVLLPAAAQLSGTVRSSTRTRLLWIHDGQETTHYRVERRAPGGVFVNAGEFSSAIGTQFDDSGLLPDRDYVYRVFAKNEAGYSAPSNEVTVHTWPLFPPTVMGQALSSTELLIGLAAVPNDVEGYRLERKAPGGAFLLVATLGAAELEYLDTGLRPATPYLYRATAFLGPDAGPPSAEVIVATPPLEAPALVAVEAESEYALAVTWVDLCRFEDGFDLERSADGGDTWQFVAFAGAALGVGAEVTYLDNDLPGPGTYAYRVRALLDDSASVWSNRLDGSTTPLASPSHLTAVPLGPDTIELRWIDNATNETGFLVEHATDGEAFHEIARRDRRAGSGAPVVFVDDGLAEGSKFYFRVCALRNGQRSAYSNVASATTDTLPAAPTNLEATRVAPRMRRYRFTDQANNEDGFVLEVALDPARAGNRTFLALQRRSPGAGATVEHLSAQLTGPGAYSVRAAAYRAVRAPGARRVRHVYGPYSPWVRETILPAARSGRR